MFTWYWLADLCRSEQITFRNHNRVLKDVLKGAATAAASLPVQMNPCVVGWPSPAAILVTRPSSTVTARAQVSGQSSGQTVE